MILPCIVTSVKYLSDHAALLAMAIRYIKSASRLRRVRNCVGELALRFEIVASFYVCQPNHSYSHFMFSLHSDLTRATVQCLVRTIPPRECPTVLFIGLWPHSFHKIMYLYSICLVSTTCCDATITKYKRNTNIQELYITSPVAIHFLAVIR